MKTIFTGPQFIAVNTMMKQAAAAELKLYRRDPDGPDKKTAEWTPERGLVEMPDRSVITIAHAQALLVESLRKHGHPEKVIRDLCVRPNPDQHGMEFWDNIADSLEQAGHCLIWTPLNHNGVAVELRLLPLAATLLMAPTKEIPNGSYLVHETANSMVIPGEQVIRLEKKGDGMTPSLPPAPPR